MSWKAEMTTGRMDRRLNIGIEQELPVDWSRIDKSIYFPTYKRIKAGIGREYYFNRKNVKESERKIWPEQDVKTHDLGRYEKNREKREDEGKKENTWRELKDQLRKGSVGLEKMKFLKQEEKNTTAKKKRCIESRR